jgi:patatin-like phospholipase/acyl hydrolase
MLEFYEKRGPHIFPLTSLGKKLSYSLASLLHPKFAQDALKAELENAFSTAPRKQFRDSNCRLVIPACHALSGAAHLFRTNHHPSLVSDADTSGPEVALATAAAPTYFSAAEVAGSLSFASTYASAVNNSPSAFSIRPFLRL